MDETQETARRAMDLFDQAMEQPSADRESWIKDAATGDKAVYAATMALFRRDQSGSGGLQTGAALDDALETPLPGRIGAYRIVRLLGQGGMGAVYEGARDAGDFERRVAIKVIRSGLLSQKLIKRFEIERQTLAGLTHPGIARLYDGGQLDDGSPYFVMEFIEGLAIGEHADAEKLGLPARLALFRDTCLAVRHAHQNLIVHRDITPSNVMVTKAGQVKLIDFGIAKPASDTGLPTAANVTAGSAQSLASLSFTPGFAAPERQAGAPATALSDVYSLGRLLEALVKNDAAPQDVHAIIEKASAEDSETRYPSVDALISDIAAYAANRPVTARGGNWAYNASKFIARRPIGVTAGILAILGLSGGLITTTALYNQSEAARIEANTRFTETRQLATFLTQDVSKRLDNIPGTQDIRKDINTKSVELLGILERAAQADPDLRYEYAFSLLLAGEQGISTVIDGEVQTDTHIEYLKKSRDVLMELMAEGTDNRDVPLLLGNTNWMLSGAYEDEPDVAIKYLDDSISIYQDLIVQYPDEPAPQFYKLRSQVLRANRISDKNGPAFDNSAALGVIISDANTLRDQFKDSERAQTVRNDIVYNARASQTKRWIALKGPVAIEERANFEAVLSDLEGMVIPLDSSGGKEPPSQSVVYRNISNLQLLAQTRSLEQAWQKTPVERRANGEAISADLDKIDRYLVQLALFSTGSKSYENSKRTARSLRAKTLWRWMDQPAASLELYQSIEKDDRSEFEEEDTVATRLNLADTLLSIAKRQLAGELPACQSLDEVKALITDTSNASAGEMDTIKDIQRELSQIATEASC